MSGLSPVRAGVTRLLQDLIRERCVNDGRPESGGESRSAARLAAHLEGPGLDLERRGPLQGRESLIARIEGTDPGAPTLLLMGHTDVVPANPSGWRHDPFGGELIDGFVWGRGAVDMLNLTASMAVAVRRLADSGWRPRGTLIYAAVADEEAGGVHGARWLCEHEWDAVRADAVVTESGGNPVETPAGRRLLVTVGEKGVCWLRLRVHGTPGHGSRPYGADNALVTAADIIRRLAAHRTASHVTEVWRRFVEGMAFPAPIEAGLLDPARVWDTLGDLPPGMARRAHASTHMTASPTVCHGGTKTNMIPDLVEIEIDIRLLPGQTTADALGLVDEACAEHRAVVEVEVLSEDAPTSSPVETPLWDALSRAVARLRPDATLIPTMTTGGTDARFFRERGVPAYGFGLFTDRIDLDLYQSMFHGNDERIDVESLDLSVALWEWLARDLLG